MKNTVCHNLRIVVLGVAVLALGASASAPIKGLTRYLLPADQTASFQERTQHGPSRVQRCPGVRPRASLFCPGDHTIELKPTDIYEYQQQGPNFFYFRVTGSVAFTAEAGHKYLAYVNIATVPSTEDNSGAYTWAGLQSKKDETTHKRVARTERLPLRGKSDTQVDPRSRSSDFRLFERS